PEARQYLEQTVKLRPNYPEAWNNLGMMSAQQGQIDDAIRHFKESLRLRHDYAIALVNLGNLYRHKGSLDEAEKLLHRARVIKPDSTHWRKRRRKPERCCCPSSKSSRSTKWLSKNWKC